MIEAILESWERQASIVENVCSLITPENQYLRTREGEMAIYEHLCHIHGVRRGWMEEVAPQWLEGSSSLYTMVTEDDWIASEDLALIKKRLLESATAMGRAMEELLEDPTSVGPYAHPIFFLQHMVWHEGWHVGEVVQALRVNGQEPSEDWEEENIWAIWRS